MKAQLDEPFASGARFGDSINDSRPWMLLRNWRVLAYRVQWGNNEAANNAMKNDEQWKRALKKHRRRGFSHRKSKNFSSHLNCEMFCPSSIGNWPEWKFVELREGHALSSSLRVAHASRFVSTACLLLTPLDGCDALKDPFVLFIPASNPPTLYS